MSPYQLSIPNTFIALYQVDNTHCVIDVDGTGSFNHLVVRLALYAQKQSYHLSLQVFLTGTQAFPDGTGGAVYFSWPNIDIGEPAWQYLGMISNAKPSAIFKISKAKGVASDDEQKISQRFNQQMLQCQIPKVRGTLKLSMYVDSNLQFSFQTAAQVGISVEPLSHLQGLQEATTESEATLVPKFVDFTQKMVQSLFNFTASYAIEASEARMRATETYVPYSAIQNWCTNFERRIKLDPYFWQK